MFGYKGKQHIKLYRPFSTPRFLYGGSFGENYCFGLEQLPAKGDTLFITGGEKDVLSLAALGFHAICFNSETVTIPANLIFRLSFRFKHIVLLYDTDKTGRESACKQERLLAEFGVKRLLLPLPGTKEEKDISDYFKAGNTREDFLKLFIEFRVHLCFHICLCHLVDFLTNRFLCTVGIVYAHINTISCLSNFLTHLLIQASNDYITFTVTTIIISTLYWNRGTLRHTYP